MVNARETPLLLLSVLHSGHENEFKICSPKWQWNVTSLSIQPISYTTPTQPCNSMSACYRYTPLAYCYMKKVLRTPAERTTNYVKCKISPKCFF